MNNRIIVITIAVSAALHAGVLLLWASPYRPAQMRMRHGDNAVSLDLLASAEAVARTPVEQTHPVTEIKQEIQRRMEQVTDQLALAVRKISEIKLPEPQEPVEPPDPVEAVPPKPVIEPIVQAAREQIDRSKVELAQCAREIAQAVEQARQQAAAEQAAAERARQEVAERAAEAERQRQEEFRQRRLAEELAKATPPKVPVEQTRPDGNADVNAQASVANVGAEGVSSEARLVGGGEPPYPHRCALDGQEGRVVLEVLILANGKVGWARLSKSSGFEGLDESALRFAREKARFAPTIQAGRPVDAVMYWPHKFTLKKE